MNITVVGASAGIGFETVKRALQRGHHVTTLSRSPINLAHDPNLIQVQGSATNKADLAKALQGAEAVIVALGTGKSMKATSLFSDFAKTLLALRAEHSSQIPHILVTGFGTGESQNYVGWFVRLFLKYFLKDVYADKAKMEELISQSELNWIIVRPGRLLDKAPTEQYRIETKLFKGINIGGINRADVADYMVKQAENPTELGKYPAISEK